MIIINSIIIITSVITTLCFISVSIVDNNALNPLHGSDSAGRERGFLTLALGEPRRYLAPWEKSKMNPKRHAVIRGTK